MGALNSFAMWGILGAVGIAVPIIIHLLYRKHRRQTDWAAMELLRRALVIRSGQVKLEDYLILFLRCLALFLLAWALLRPTMSSDSALSLGNKKVGIVVAIDASFSMNHGEHSRFERALDKARLVAQTAKEGDPMSIVLMSNRPQVLLRGAGYVPGKVEDVLDNETASTPYRLGLERNIELLNELVGALKTPGKECYLITDSQELDWAKLSETARDSLQRLTQDANVFVIPAGSEGDENLSLGRLSYASGSLRQSGVARFSAQIRNTGRRVSDGGNVEFFVDGKLSKRRAVGSLDPGEVRGISFFANFEKPGDVRLRAELSKDELVDDNVRHLIAHISSGITVLCVEGSSPNQNTTDRTGAYYALRALRLKDRGVDSPVHVEQIEAADLSLENLGDYDVVLLANVADLAPEMVDRLKKFVHRGGGLMVFAGDRVKASQYNERFGSGPDGLLPAALGEVAEFKGDGIGWTIAKPKSDHLLAGVVTRLPEKLLDSARITKTISVVPAPGSETILSVAETGAPLLLARNDIGSGTVLFLTTSADRTWNDLAIHPLYAMLLQQAATNLTSHPDALQLTVGEEIALPVAGREVGDSVALLAPDGEKSALRVTQNRDQTVAAIEFDHLGVYEIAADGQKPAVVVAANVDAAESNVRVVDGEALEGQLQSLGVKVITKEDPTALTAAIEDARQGRELATFLLWLAVFIFLLQSILARYFTNKMDRDDAPDLAATLQLGKVAAARRT